MSVMGWMGNFLRGRILCVVWEVGGRSVKGCVKRFPCVGPNGWVKCCLLKMSVGVGKQLI